MVRKSLDYQNIPRRIKIDADKKIVDCDVDYDRDIDVSAVTESPPELSENEKTALIKDALNSQEARIKLGNMLKREIEEEMYKRHFKPLCHSVFHENLGKPCFKDTCPICGYKVEDKKDG